MASNNQGNQGSKQGDGRGFASMDPERQREIASQGGKAAHESGQAHEFTSEEAREAGRKGGQASQGGGAQGGQQGGKEEGQNGGQKSTRGGTSEQHAEAGRQSRKNDKG
ncbi:MAG: stress-induced protein [Polaromonas sp.]|nr:stress-induced protein [Polaromonas sp.]